MWDSVDLERYTRLGFLFVVTFSEIRSLGARFFISLCVFSGSLSSVRPAMSESVLLRCESPARISLTVSL